MLMLLCLRTRGPSWSANQLQGGACTLKHAFAAPGRHFPHRACQESLVWLDKTLGKTLQLSIGQGVRHVCCSTPAQSANQHGKTVPTRNSDQTLEASRRLEQLRKARQKSIAGQNGGQFSDVAESRNGTEDRQTAKLVSTPKAVDRRVYDQVAASRNRLSQQLSAKNRYIRHLESILEDRTTVVANAHTAVLRIANELDSIKRLSEVAIAAASYGVDKADVIARSERIIKRAALLQQAMFSEADTLNKLVTRKVPVVWYGVASEVKVMGDFDNWSHGFSLSPEDIQDQTFTCFHSDIPLLPGSYQVKFLVDSEWRLAPEWPTTTTADGSTNNLLVVE